MDVTRRSRPNASGRPIHWSSGTRPAAPIATSVCPSLQARPKESAITTAGRTPSASAMPDRRRAAERSGSSGSSTSSPPSADAFDWSTPALAHTKPWRVTQMSVPSTALRSSADSSSTACTRRASLPCSPASARACSPGSISSRRRTRPSAFDTTLCAITSTSPSRSSSGAPAAIRPARSSPGRTGGSGASELTLSVVRPGPAPAGRSTPRRVRAGGASPRVEGAWPRRAPERRASSARSPGVSTSSARPGTSATRCASSAASAAAT